MGCYRVRALNSKLAFRQANLGQFDVMGGVVGVVCDLFRRHDRDNLYVNQVAAAEAAAEEPADEVVAEEPVEEVVEEEPVEEEKPEE